MMYFHNSTLRERKELLEGISVRTFWGERMLLSLVDLEPYAVIPTHSHPHEQVGIVLKGQFTFTIANESRRVGPGDIYIIPMGVAHSVTMNSEPGQVLEVFSPVREEYKY